MTRRVLLPPITEIGTGSLNRLPEVLDLLEIRKILVIADPNLPPRLTERLKELCGGRLSGGVLSGPQGEPTTDVVDHFAACARDRRSDGVLAVGGGSTMDLGKAVSVVVGAGGLAYEYQGVDRVVGSGIPAICAPTTAGSGAEATKSAVLTRKETQVKRGINSLGVMPDAVILDPELLLTLPEKPRLAALLDAAAHAIESYVGLSRWSISAMLSSAAFPLIGKHMRLDVESLSTAQAEGALLGSFFAGAAICNSETGAVHALAYPLTEFFGVPHAYAVGALLPDVMMSQLKSCSDQLESASLQMGFASTTEFIRQCHQVRAKLGILDEVREILGNSENLDRVVDRSLTLGGALKNSPRSWSRADIRECLLLLGES